MIGRSQAEVRVRPKCANGLMPADMSAIELAEDQRLIVGRLS
jgi:hypothetical protein